MLGFVALGLWHHLYFSYSVGEFAFFKNAYDEDAYVMFPFGLAGVRPDRLLSGTLVSSLLWLARGSYGFALITMDALLPPLIFLAAYFAGSALFTKVSARCLFALLLVFATDLFSLGSLASYPGPFPTLDHFKALVGPQFVPPFETSYLGLYRSPEPQVSYVVGFVFVGLLLRIVFGRHEDLDRREVTRLAVGQLLLMTCYAVVSFPVMLIEGLASAVLWIDGRRRSAIILAVLFLASIIAIPISARITLGPSTSVLFPSRLPIITVGVILALAGSCALILLLLRNRKADPRLMIGLIFAVTPLALTNQQILTGMMASTREWERYVDLPFVVIAAGIFISCANWQPRRWLIGTATITIAGFVAMASYRTYQFWLPDNLKSLAIARAITAAGTALDADTLLVLDQPEYAPFVHARLGHPFQTALNYLAVFQNPVLSTTEFEPTVLADSLFEYWRQTGVTAEQARSILEQEARERGGYYSGFLFSICEYWYPCTDGRGVKSEKITAQIPAAIELYMAFLSQPSSRKFAFVASKTSAGSSKGPTISKGQALSVTVQISSQD
jgi:hypothetical protein